MTLTVSILHFLLVFGGGERSLSGNDTLPGHCMESSASSNTLFKVLLLWENSWVVLQHPILRLQRGESRSCMLCLEAIYALLWSHIRTHLLFYLLYKFRVGIIHIDLSLVSSFCAQVKVVIVYLLISSSYLCWFTAHGYLSCENSEKDFNI